MAYYYYIVEDQAEGRQEGGGGGGGGPVSVYDCPTATMPMPGQGII